MQDTERPRQDSRQTPGWPTYCEGAKSNIPILRGQRRERASEVARATQEGAKMDVILGSERGSDPKTRAVGRPQSKLDFEIVTEALTTTVAHELVAIFVLSVD